jgi:glycosyltransferase involved in cell wall biosynthesis
MIFADVKGELVDDTGTSLPTSRTPIPIAFCITELDPGGAEKILMEIAAGLDRRDWSPHVYCLGKPGQVADELRLRGVPVTSYQARGIWDAWRVVNRLTSDLSQQRPQLLQTFLFHGNILGRLAGYRAGVPVIVSGIRVAERDRRWQLWIDRLSNRLVSRNICVSEEVALFSEQVGGLDRRKSLVIPNGVDRSRFRRTAAANWEEFGLPVGCRPLVTVGRLTKQKGHAVLLEAWSKVSPMFSSEHLVFVGDGELRDELKKQALDLKINQSTHFLGYQSNIAGSLRGAGAFVLPSLWEGMPNVLLEALAAGLPVVSTRVEGTPPLVVEGSNGWLVQPGDAGDLATGIIRLLQAKSRWAEMGVNSQTILGEDFTIEGMVDRYAACYQALCESQRNQTGETASSAPSPKIL